MQIKGENVALSFTHVLRCVRNHPLLPQQMVLKSDLQSQIKLNTMQKMKNIDVNECHKIMPPIQLSTNTPWLFGQNCVGTAKDVLLLLRQTFMVIIMILWLLDTGDKIHYGKEKKKSY